MQKLIILGLAAVTGGIAYAWAVEQAGRGVEAEHLLDV
jgi:hypothetical protein